MTKKREKSTGESRQASQLCLWIFTLKQVSMNALLVEMFEVRRCIRLKELS